MGHRYSHHRRCHSFDSGHCHGYSRVKICGYNPCCCHHPRIMMNPTMAGVMWMARRHRRKMRGMQICECGGYVPQQNVPPPRPPPPAIMPPQPYSPITPYPQVQSPSVSPPYPPSSHIQPQGNPYQPKPTPMPMPEPGFSRSLYNPQQQSLPPRSHSPPPPYDFK